MRIEKIQKKNAILIILLIASFSLALPLILRSNNQKIIGIEPHYHKIVSEDITNYGVPQYNYGLITEPYIFQPYDYVLGYLNRLFRIDISLFLQILIGIIFIILFYIFLEKIKIKKSVCFISTIFLAISPFFIRMFTTLNPFAIQSTMLLIALHLQIKKSEIWKSISYFILILMIFWSPLLVILSLLLMLVLNKDYDINKNSKKTKMPLLMILSFIISILYSIYLLITFGFYNILISNYFNPAKSPLISKLISDFGALYGVGASLGLLSLLWFFISWDKNNKSKSIYLFILITVVGALFSIQIRILFGILISIFAAKSFIYLYKKQWNQKILKSATILVIVCGVLFSFVSFQARLVSSQPSQEIIESLEFLRDYDSGIVFTHQNYGLFVQYYSKNPVYLDSIFLEKQQAINKLNESLNIFKSQSLEYINNTFINENFRYVYITPSMKEELVWKTQRKGLLFVMDNADIFEKIYDKNGIEIWRFSGDLK